MISFGTQGLYMWKASVDSGSFTRAAEICGCSASAVSKYISLMERETDSKFRYGSKRRMFLTDAGKDWYIVAEHFIKDTDLIMKGEGECIRWEYETLSSMRKMNEGQREEVIRLIRRITC